jgi:hypothetical protein
MKTYLEETLSFIESEEMRDYLRTRTDWLCDGWRVRYKCAEIVSYAPAPLEKKLPVLELIAEQTEYDDYHDPAKLAKSTRAALSERYENIPAGAVFQLKIFEYGILTDPYYTELFTSFDAAISQIKELEEDHNDKPDRSKYTSYTIYKHIPGNDGQMEEYCFWKLNSSGEIWYFGYGDSDFEPEDWEDLFDYIGNLTLLVPFKAGDIILADCRPFAKERRVLFMGCYGEEDDCCAAQCLFVQPDGKINRGAFSHNHFLPWDESSHISGHYRAAVWNGELPEHEAPLAVISAAIKADPEWGTCVMEYLYGAVSNDVYRKLRGATWRRIKRNS